MATALDQVRMKVVSVFESLRIIFREPGRLHDFVVGISIKNVTWMAGAMAPSALHDFIQTSVIHNLGIAAISADHFLNDMTSMQACGLSGVFVFAPWRIAAREWKGRLCPSKPPCGFELSIALNYSYCILLSGHVAHT